MEADLSTMPRREPTDLLDETFLIYFKHFWRFTGLVLVIAGPIGLLTAVLFQITNGKDVPFAIVVIVRGLATVLIFSAGAVAVGQQYVMGNIGIRECLTQAWHRFVSLSLSTGALVLAVVLPLILTVNPLRSLVGTIAKTIGDFSTSILLMVLGLLALLIILTFWCLILNAIVVEGNRPVEALKRTFGLVRTSVWRVFASSVLMGLAAFGLGILVTVPFAATVLVTGASSDSVMAGVVQSLGGIFVGILVPPVIFIGGTLLYYDLRVRQEGYNLNALSQEIAAPVV